MEDRCFLVLDTESTVCLRRRRRLLVALAYELVWPDLSRSSDTATDMVYDIVALPADVEPDPRSEEIHGIGVAASREMGRPLREALVRLFRFLARHKPVAIVGHDVVGDVRLLVSEAVLAGCACGSLPAALMRLICTRMIATPRCAIPMRTCGRHGRDVAPPPAAVASTPQGFKWPSLTETYDLLVTQQIDERCAHLKHPIHDARGDVERCREVFLSLIRRRVISAPGSDTAIAAA